MATQILEGNVYLQHDGSLRLVDHIDDKGMVRGRFYRPAECPSVSPFGVFVAPLRNFSYRGTQPVLRADLPSHVREHFGLSRTEPVTIATSQEWISDE